VTASVSPLGAAGTQLRITSDNPRVAMADQNGLITGVSPGTATITITFRATDGSGRTATHRVTVRERPVPPVENPEDWWVLNAFGLISQPGNAFLQRILGNINAFVIFAFGRRDWNESSSENSLEEFLRSVMLHLAPGGRN